jgi:hypothetical protein
MPDRGTSALRIRSKKLSRWREKTRRKTMIKITCEAAYCYKQYDPELKDALEWRSIEVRIDRGEFGTDVSIESAPIDPERINLAHHFACPKHWREVAIGAADKINWFPEPEPSTLIPPETDTAINQQDLPVIDPEKAF